MGSLTTVAGQKDSQRVGFRLIQNRGTVGAGTGGDDFRELGLFIVQQGAYEMNPEVNGSDNHVSRTRAGILLENSATGTYGQSGGWGIYQSGSLGIGKNYFAGRMGLGNHFPPSGQQLVVEGNVSASGALTVDGNINAKGNIVGDDATDITGIEAVRLQRLGIGNAYEVFDESAAMVRFNQAEDSLGIDLRGFDGSTRILMGDSEKIEMSGSVRLNSNLDVGGTYTNNTQPAFLALNSGTDNNLAIDTDVKIEFNSEAYDQASNFNTTTDTFTAPVTGKYLLTTQLRLDDIDTASTWISCRIVTSNREYRRFIDPNFSADLNQFGMNMTTIADMDANDTAHVEFKQSGGTAQVDSDSGNPGTSPPQLDTFFSGHLLG